MNKLLKRASIIATLLFPLNAHSSGWVNNANIQYLYAGTAGNRYAVKLVDINPNPGNMCAESYDLSMEETNPKLKEMWALLLSAYMANKPVNLYLKGCGGHLNSPLVTDVSIGSVQ